ncbi:hypothetical protein EVAR_67391_1 [Eumeta japonica]|uniref:Uncharacterized protein n=1 Tax=Eumeta variegata TaxID=151549 RepID=A0A4C2A430_EUMVA|nr:hypothetical protein EVAR_67391_1 [Eumeta japonica]
MGNLVNELSTEFNLNHTFRISGSTLSHRSRTLSPRQQPLLQPALHGGRKTYASRVLGGIYPSSRRSSRSKHVNRTNDPLLEHENSMNIRGVSPDQDAIQHQTIETAKINQSSSFDV